MNNKGNNVTRDEETKLNIHLHHQGLRELRFDAYKATFRWGVDMARLTLADVLAMDRNALDAEYERLNS